jgi:hypothetical protein
MFGDTIESIRKFSVETQRSTGNIDVFELELARPDLISPLRDLFPGSAIIITDSETGLDNPTVRLAAEGRVRYKITSPRLYFGRRAFTPRL